MKVWVKICGITRVEDAVAAVRAGADAIGLNFCAANARRCDEDAASAIVGAVKSEVGDAVELYGVFAGQAPERIATTVVAIGLTGVQLHGEESRTQAAAVRAALPASVALVRAVAVTSARAAADALADRDGWRVLLDSPRGGGSGTRFDDRLLSGLDLGDTIVAGGLTPANVGDVVARLRPYGVDTAGGVETAKGVKDHASIREFIEHANGRAS